VHRVLGTEKRTIRFSSIESEQNPDYAGETVSRNIDAVKTRRDVGNARGRLRDELCRNVQRAALDQALIRQRKKKKKKGRSKHHR